MFGFDFRQGQGAAFMSGTKNDLFVIEDIDTIANGLNRDTKKDKDGSNPFEERAMFGSPLHEILNSMDGMQTPDGLKFIVTTNHLDKLDPAIVRPGRIDDVIEVGPHLIESARRMFTAFYGRGGIDGYSPRTGAELQQMFSTMMAEDAEAELSRTAPADAKEAA
jgi:chaperone BCS1